MKQLILFLSVILLSLSGGKTFAMGKRSPEQKKETNAYVHPDLRVEKVDFADLRNQLDREINKLSHEELQIDQLSVSIPDYKGAYKTYKNDVEADFKNYLLTVGTIGAQVRQTLAGGYSRIEALQKEESKDSTGVFKKLKDVEISRFLGEVKDLNNQINGQYYTALGNLLNLYSVSQDTQNSDSSSAKPTWVSIQKDCVAVERYYNDVYYYPKVLAYDIRGKMIDAETIGDNYFKSMSHCYSYLRGGFDSYGLTIGNKVDEAKDELLNRVVRSGEVLPYQAQLARCKTGGCVLALSSNLESWIRFSSTLNSPISFDELLKQSTYNYQTNYNDMTVDPKITLAMLNAAKSLITDPAIKPNTPYSPTQVLGAYLEKAIKMPVGMGVAILSAPVMVLEETALFADKYLKGVMGNRYAELHVSLNPINSWTANNTLNMMKLRSQNLVNTLPTVIFEKAPTNGQPAPRK